MTIGEISRLTGFSPDTLRWYEKQELISPGRNTLGRNNYRIYSQQTLVRLQAIKQMKSLGFTLNEIKELMILDDLGDLQCESVAVLVNTRLRVLEEKIKILQQMHAQLSKVKDTCKGNCKEALNIAS